MKILYKTLFGSKFDPPPINKYSNAIEDLTFSLFETKEIIQSDQESINCITAHERYPLIFASNRNGEVMVIWSQTMKVISLLVGAKHPLMKIHLSPSGDRVVAIDSNNNIEVWRFNLLSKRINHQMSIKSRTVYDISFLNDSSMFLVLTKETLVLYDLLTYSSSDFEAPNVIAEIQAHFLFYLPAYQLCILINSKKKKLTTVDISSKQVRNENAFDSSVGEFVSSIINRLGTVLCVGTLDGEVILFNTKTLEQIIIYRPFEKEQMGRLFE